MSRPTVRAAVAVFVVALLVAGAVLAQKIRVGSFAPDFTAKDVNGKMFKLSSYKGKVVFLNFFATWCPPCREEFPELVKLHEKYQKNSNVLVVSVALERPETMRNLKPFLERNKAKHVVLAGPETDTAAQRYEVQYIPTNFLIGKDGKVAGVWGFTGQDDLKKWDAAIRAALEKK
ncbi:MAG: TlpA disulfide reductase family protein [Armatimonadota bacterium]